MDIVTATTTKKPGEFVSDKPLEIETPSAKQKDFIKWLASIPADGKEVKNGRIKPLDERIANLKKALAKHIKLFKATFVIFHQLAKNAFAAVSIKDPTLFENP